MRYSIGLGCVVFLFGLFVGSKPHEFEHLDEKKDDIFLSANSTKLIGVQRNRRLVATLIETETRDGDQAFLLSIKNYSDKWVSIPNFSKGVSFIVDNEEQEILLLAGSEKKRGLAYQRSTSYLFQLKNQSKRIGKPLLKYNYLGTRIELLNIFVVDDIKYSYPDFINFRFPSRELSQAGPDRKLLIGK